MPRYDEAFVDRLLAPWNRHDVEGALALMTDGSGRTERWWSRRRTEPEEPWAF